jgi:hypothetical protein
MAVALHFTTGCKDCIDWSDPANRSKAVALGLKPGDLILAEIMEKEGRMQARKIQLLASASEVIFTGQEKITDASIITALHEPPKVRIIVLLKGYERFKDLIADPKSRDRARREIKRLQEEVLKSLPQDSFELERRLENVPSFSGQATFSGLKALAAHHLVASIEEDRLLELH